MTQPDIPSPRPATPGSATALGGPPESPPVDPPVAAALEAARKDAVAEVVTLASELIAIDTTNTGDPDAPSRERAAAEYVAAKLAEVGYDPVYVESGAPGRGNVVARLTGADPRRDALLVHGHLDVVPADADEWTSTPSPARCATATRGAAAPST